MDFQVSALKWRPQKFGQLVGQDHIIRTLTNAIELDRVAHSYVFSGTRGVGKTTTARIFAKALNCENGPTMEPCDSCSFCVEIRQGNCIDVLEIDGASNNGVAEVRDLIDNIQYATSSCRYKIYIIDEVHMLSRSAFNALLKTLEEPPSKVVFMFATTELLKIPETILSRCQRFEFKPLTRKQVIGQMEQICREESIDIDQGSLEQLAKNGSGSMRDSQSLLDQVIAFCGKEIRRESVESVLGVVARDILEKFFSMLSSRDAAGLIAQIQEIADTGKDLQYFCRDLIEYTRNLILIQVARDPATLLDNDLIDLPTLRKQAETFHSDELHQIFTVLSHAESEMKRSPHAQMVFEMAVLRLTDIRPFHDIVKLIQDIDRLAEKKSPEIANDSLNHNPKPFVQSTVATTYLVAEHPVGAPETDGNVPSSFESGAISDSVENIFHGKDIRALWKKSQNEILETKVRFGHYFQNCRVAALPPSTLRLEFLDDFTLGLVKKEENLKVIREVLQKNFNAAVKLETGIQPVSEITELGRGDDSGNKEEEKKRTEEYNRKSVDQSQIQIIQDALDIFGGAVIR